MPRGIWGCYVFGFVKNIELQYIVWPLNVSENHIKFQEQQYITNKEQKTHVTLLNSTVDTGHSLSANYPKLYFLWFSMFW